MFQEKIIHFDCTYARLQAGASDKKMRSAENVHSAPQAIIPDKQLHD